MSHENTQGLSDDLKEVVCVRTSELLEMARRYFGVSIPPPTIRFDLRGKTAGQFRVQRDSAYEVRFNAVLLGRHRQDFLMRTVPHEIAHLVVYRLHGHRTQPHGQEWRAVMQLFGAEPERCHSYDVTGLKTRELRRYQYRCGCRSHELTSIRHRRAQRGQTYLCRLCGETLKRTPAAE